MKMLYGIVVEDRFYLIKTNITDALVTFEQCAADKENANSCVRLITMRFPGESDDQSRRQMMGRRFLLDSFAEWPAIKQVRASKDRKLVNNDQVALMCGLDDIPDVKVVGFADSIITVSAYVSETWIMDAYQRGDFRDINERLLDSEKSFAGTLSVIDHDVSRNMVTVHYSVNLEDVAQ